MVQYIFSSYEYPEYYVLDATWGICGAPDGNPHRISIRKREKEYFWPETNLVHHRWWLTWNMHLHHECKVPQTAQKISILKMPKVFTDALQLVSRIHSCVTYSLVKHEIRCLCLLWEGVFNQILANKSMKKKNSSPVSVVQGLLILISGCIKCPPKPPNFQSCSNAVKSNCSSKWKFFK